MVTVSLLVLLSTALGRTPNSAPSSKWIRVADIAGPLDGTKAGGADWIKLLEELKFEGHGDLVRHRRRHLGNGSNGASRPRLARPSMPATSSREDQYLPALDAAFSGHAGTHGTATLAGWPPPPRLQRYNVTVMTPRFWRERHLYSATTKLTMCAAILLLLAGISSLVVACDRLVENLAMGYWVGRLPFSVNVGSPHVWPPLAISLGMSYASIGCSFLARRLAKSDIDRVAPHGR